MGLSWPPKGRPPAELSARERECDELREQFAQACRDLDELHGLVGELIVDRERLDWWLGCVGDAVAQGGTPRVYRSRGAIDVARRR